VTAGGARAGQNTPRLLVGVDDNPATLRAVGWAAREAVVRGAELDLVQVHPPGGAGPGPHPPTGRASALLDQARRAAHAVAANLVVRLTVVEGSFGPALAEAASGAALLVTGSQTPPRTFAPGVGRTVAHLLGHAPCPVVVVPQSWTTRSVDAGEVVVGIDTSRASIAASRFAAGVAERWGVELTAVTIGRRAEEDELHRGLAEAAAGLAEDHPDLRVRELVRSGSVSQELLRTGSSTRLLVLASGGRGVLGTVLLGSICRAVVAAADCPVAVVPTALVTDSDADVTTHQTSSV
jgi:nucleotide-binding universal stress UspA family protein